MEAFWTLEDEREIQTYFPDQELATPGEEHVRQVIAATRRALQRVASAYWNHYLQEVDLRGLLLRLDPETPGFSEQAQGYYLVVDRAKGDRTGEAGGQKFTLCEALQHTWAIPHDAVFAELSDRLDQVRSNLQWTASTEPDYIGAVTGTITLEEPGREQVQALVLRLKAAWIPGLVAAFLHPQKGWRFPGLQAALDKLALVSDQQKALTVADPRDLLRRLCTTLVEDDLDTFKNLWVSNLSDTYHKQRFTQLKRTYQESRGQVDFAGYASGYSPDDYPGCGKIRMLVSRTTPTGERGQNVLVCIQEQNQWRLETGTF
ncbi:MAG: hypothetical protein JW797_01665 [Bradymonadales bacterium]|nr:hypothetical protein [Bradymonadales bacterium]